MDATYWTRQTTNKPAFPDILWSQPENKRYAGKLLVVGGDGHTFSEVSSAYNAALKAGVGHARLLFPHSFEKLLGKTLPEAEFAPSTISGGFSRESLSSLLDAASWADGVLLAGNFGKNSETAILLESFIDRYKGQLALCGDSLDYFLNKSGALINRPNTVLAGTFGQLQKLFVSQTILKHSMDLAQVVSHLHDLTLAASITTHYAGQAIILNSHCISTTPIQDADLTQLAAYASVWCLQQPSTPFESLSASIFEYVAQA